MQFFLLQSLFPFLLIVSFLSINVELSLCQNDQQFTNCSSELNCGGVGNISYPFYGVNRASYCGQPGYEVQCLDNVPVFNMTGASYRILQMNTTNPWTVKVARNDYWGSICNPTFVNTTLNFSLFDYVTPYTNMTFYYQCPTTITLPNVPSCNTSSVFYLTRPMTVSQPSSVTCTNEVIVPVYTTAALAIEAGQTTTISDAVDGGFSLQLQIDNDQCDKCLESGGQCGLNTSTNSGFSCFCADQAYASICNGTQSGGKGKPIKLIVSLTVVCFIGVLGAIVFGLCRMRAKQKGTVVCFIGVLGARVFGLCRMRAKQKGHIKITRKHIKMTRDTLQEYIGGKHDLSELLIYDFDSILVATDNFSIENKLGQGGFGPVYWGKLAEGKEIAVKRLSSTSGQGVVEFKNEMLLISNLQHKNLVRIMGCCVKEDEKLLIYEFMPNKSLDTFLFDSTRRAVLDWGTRFNIIQGVARGLVYLHHDSYLKVIHRDLKVSNILLDEKMNPKISDFGLARSIEGTQNLENTQRVAGTRGYMSPEYAMGGIFSQKSDVYSFGVLLLEIISSKKNTAFYIYDRQLGLLAYAWQLWKEGRELELVDEMLAADSYSASEVMKCVHIGLLCVQDNAMDRPSMPDVVFMLNGSTTIIGGAQPKQPLFTIQNTVSHPQPQPANTFLTNEATMTLIEGR